MDESTDTVYNELPAGRYEFKDSGIYIGEWLNEKAVGIGLLTKDKSQGEFTGLWNSGSEKCGVFLWPSAPGAMYEGEWANSKRHGHGIFVKEDWIIMGKFREGFITLGVKTKDKSVGKFEGEFEDGCPVFGMETYTDGGNYCGDYKSGLREGYGVRTSIPYGEIFSFLPDEKHKLLAVKSENDNSNDTLVTGNHVDKNGSLSKLPNKFKCGFVLSGRKSDLLIKKLRHISACKKHQKGIKRSKSLTSVFSALKKKELYSANFHKSLPHQFSIKSAPGNVSPKSCHSSLTFHTIASIAAMETSNSDTIAPDTVETYSGQWIQDQRHGFGVCERSDGVIYEGGWFNNKKHGFGITKFPDGSFEEGQYQNGRLIYLWTKRNPLFFLHTFRMGLYIKKAVKTARHCAQSAQEKAVDCQKKLNEIRDAVKRAKEAAALAREYSLETRQLVKEMYPDYEQPGIKCLKDIVRMMRVTKRGHKAFETMLQAALDVVEGRGVPEILSNPENLGIEYDKDNFLLIDSKGKQRASRHGSFRRSKRVESENPSEEPVLEAKATQKLSTVQRRPRPQIKEPQIPLVKINKASVVQSPVIQAEIQPIKITPEKSELNKLVDGNNNENEDNTDDSQEEHFVTVSNIVATSLIPQKPLEEILNVHAIVDYFPHYLQPMDNQSEHSKTIHSSSSTSSLSSVNNARRFTVPEIMGEQSVSPLSITEALPELHESDEEKEFASNVMFFFDNGIHKRISRMESTDSSSIQGSRVTLSPPQDKLSPLPVKFNFQSQLDFRKDLNEGSMPDVSVARRKKIMSREEANKLGEECREALAREKEKLKQGVFVIRFYKIADWLRENCISILVIIVNICVIYLFIRISQDFKIS